jgi:dihydroneopterin aldolase
MRSARIEIRGLRVFAHHGVHEAEREQGQTFVLDLWLECPPSPADQSDDLADAVDYSAVCDRVVELATGGPYRLLERLAAVIADDVVARFGVAHARVRVAKPDVPIRHPLDHVAVVAEASASPNSDV